MGAAEQERSDDRLHVLSSALRAFAEATTDYERLLEVIARTVGSIVADGCIVRLLAEGEWLEPVAAHLQLEAHVADRETAARVRAFLLTRQRVADYVWGPSLIETGEPFVMSSLAFAEFRQALAPAVAEVYEAAAIDGLLVAVLRSRGVSIGTLSLFRFGAGSRPFDEGDLEMAQALADHAALAIANARSYAAERAARDAAERATARFTRLSDVGLLGVMVAELDGRVLEINRTLLDLTGYTEDEMLTGAVSWLGVTAPEWAHVDRKAIADLKASGVAGLREKELVCKGGGRVTVLGGSATVGPNECISFFLDITERRRTEAALRASEARYRLMFDESPMPKWVYDAETLRVLDVNATAVHDFGYSREEFLAMRITDLRPPEDVPAFLEAERGAAASPRFGVWRVRKRGGDTIQVEITKHSIALDGRLCRIAVGKDITERLRLEEQLRQSQKMEAIGRLAGGVAHDFNNVLSVILSYAEVLLEDIEPGQSMRADVEEIQSAGRRAADLTRQLLMFSRQQVLEPRVLDLTDVLKSMSKMLERLVGADVEIVSVTREPLGSVRADPSSVEQVIMNLVVNARDAMPTGGKLTLETHDVVLDEGYARAHVGAKPGPHVMLAVTDTGSGMDAATLGRIFEPFFTTKGIGKGTGLGLSTVFGIVQQSGGSIFVYSEPRVGTTFKIYLPRVDDAADEVPEVEAVAARGGSETILLVEDDEQVRVVARSILEKHGYRVLEARNAAEALSHAEHHPGPIHLLLSDVVMPQMSGPALAKRLAATRPDMKVLCMSGYTDDSIVRHGVIEAELAFLQKPFTPEALTKRVRDVLRGSHGGG
ncbi:MAG TPA: PAS domain S-box protein [Minicystis sp.]|nr:PAS domain S-box protein [Minicystis sp.]